MIALVAWLSLVAPAAATPPAPVLALADAPLAPARRLDWAVALLARPGFEEVGVAVLSRLINEPTVGPAARAALVTRFTQVDAQPRWAGVMAKMLETSSFDGRDVVSLRLAELRLADRSTRPQGLAELDRLTTFATPDTLRIIGRALMRAGEPAAAATAFSRIDDNNARAQRALAALAANDLVTARALAGAGANPPGLAAALADPSANQRAAALAANGYTRLARMVLESASLAAVGRPLAELYRAEGRLPEATAALLAWRGTHPDDEAARQALIDVQLARGRYADALKLYSPGDPAIEQLQPIVAYRKAWEAHKAAKQAELLPAAWAAAPSDAFIAKEQAKSLIAARHPADALPILGLVLDAAPTDEEALGLYNIAAMGAQTTGSAVRRQLAAAAVAASPKAWSSRMATASDLMSIHAEELKTGGAAEDALEPYFTSLLLDTPDAGQLMGAGGLLWQAQHLDGAEDLYRAALAQNPRSADALVASVRLLLQLGREDDALRLLEATPSRDSRVKLLNVTVTNALRAREAKAAQRAGDLEVARLLWAKLAEEYPDQADFHHGLGDTLAGLGAYDQALVEYQKTLALDPKDAWAALAEANCLVALGRPDDARVVLDRDYPEGVDAVADGQKVTVLAASWRGSAALLQGSGADEEAFEAWRTAFELVPERYALDGLASMYLGRDQPEVALAFSEEVLGIAADDEPALVGRALALANLGRWEEARTAANALARPGAPESSTMVRTDLLQRLAVEQSEYDRRVGAIDVAVARLQDTIKTVGPTPDLWTALTAAALDAHQCPIAMDAATRALLANPRSRWALSVALRAESVCKTADAVYVLLQDADRRAGAGFAAEELRASRFEVEVQRAEKLGAAGRAKEALAPMRNAQSMGALSADEWARIGGAWLALARPDDAIAAFQHTLALDNTHVPAIIGLAGAYRAEARLGAAESHLQESWDRVRDPRVGLQLVQTLIQRGKYDKAAEILSAVRTTKLPAEPVPTPEIGDPPFLVLPLPSGRIPGPRTYPPVPPRDLQPRWLVDAVDSVDIELTRERGTEVTVAAGVFSKPGTAGEQALDGWYVPAQVIFPPIGLFRPNADVVLVHLDNGVTEATGVAPSVGIASPAFRKFFATARIGTSPIGFTELNVLWHAHARLGVAPNLALGVMTARTPKSDSLLSWAGAEDAQTGVFHGFVSELWGAGYASWTPGKFDLGAQIKGGYTEGFGVDPNLFGELVAWGGGRFGGDRDNLHLGGQFVYLGNERQEDGFLLPHGGYFSPPLFVMAVAELKGATQLGGNRGRLCGAVSAGPQYTEGQDTSWFGSGLSGTGRASAGASWRLAPRWSVGLDARMQRSTSGWHQEAALLHTTIGLRPEGPSAPSMVTTASAGSIVLATDDLCSVE